jgi:enediyne biosynthesis protein E4
LTRDPGSDEAVYLLGICAQTQGRGQAALDILARVAPGSAFSYQAILARIGLCHDSGRFATAEQIIIDSAKDPRNERTDLRVLLVPIYGQLGRLDETLRLIEDQWEHLNNTDQGASERVIDLVRMHIEIDFKPNLVENVRTYLDQALQLAPDDNRVWLGRANLAIGTRDYDEAKRWLDACVKHRPEDHPVWRLRLVWGMATNRIDVV